jgi:hypothetical protein
MKYLAVQQDFAHHIQSEPVMQVADMVLFSWPIPLPDGFDRIATPLICAERLDVFRAHWETSCPEVPPVDPKPIPAPYVPEDEPQEVLS